MRRAAGWGLLCAGLARVLPWLGGLLAPGLGIARSGLARGRVLTGLWRSRLRRDRRRSLLRMLTRLQVDWPGLALLARVLPGLRGRWLLGWVLPGLRGRWLLARVLPGLRGGLLLGWVVPRLRPGRVRAGRRWVVPLRGWLPGRRSCLIGWRSDLLGGCGGFVGPGWGLFVRQGSSHWFRPVAGASPDPRASLPA